MTLDEIDLLQSLYLLLPVGGKFILLIFVVCTSFRYLFVSVTTTTSVISLAMFTSSVPSKITSFFFLWSRIEPVHYLRTYVSFLFCLFISYLHMIPYLRDDLDDVSQDYSHITFCRNLYTRSWSDSFRNLRLNPN